MKQIYLKFSMLLLFVMVGLNVFAEDVVYKTALFGANYNSKKVQSYSDKFSSTNNGFTVDVENFNNNQNVWEFIKAGSKSASYVATISTAASIDKAVTKIVVTIDAIIAESVNKITLYSGTSEESITTEEGTFEKAKGEQAIKISSPSANKYYKISFDCKTGTSNGLVQVSKVEYFIDGTDVSVPSLSSISLSGTLAKNTYIVGESFEYDGLKVTANYDGNSSVDVTSSVDWAIDPATFSEAGSKNVTVSVSYNGKSASATYSVEVSEAPIEPAPTGVRYRYQKIASKDDIKVGETYLIVCEAENTAMGSQSTDRRYNASVEINNNEIYTEVNVSGKPYEVTLGNDNSNYTMILSDGTYLGNGSASGNNLRGVIKVASGYHWTIEYSNGDVVMTTDHTTPRILCVNTDNKSDSYATYKSASSYKAVTLYKRIIPTITLNASGYATFSYASDVEISGANVYTAKIDKDKIVCTKVEGNKVPAYNGVLLYGEPSATVSILPTVNAPAINDNALKATTVEGGLATGEPAYVLSGDTFKNYTGDSFAENKAYFAQSDIQAKVISIVMDESTSINLVKETEANTPAYNLQGVRVVPSTKGFVIINGKKFYNK